MAGTHPGGSEPAFTLGDDEVELGVGIHGERGTARIPFATADELTARLVDPLVAELGLARGSDAIAIVNGLGSTYPLELQIVARAMHRRLTDRGIGVARSLVGTYVTSLGMRGVSVTLMPADPDLLPWWDAPVRTSEKPNIREPHSSPATSRFLSAVACGPVGVAGVTARVPFRDCSRTKRLPVLGRGRGQHPGPRVLVEAFQLVGERFRMGGVFGAPLVLRAFYLQMPLVVPHSVCGEPQGAAFGSICASCWVR